MRTKRLSLSFFIIGLACFELVHVAPAGVYNYTGNGDTSVNGGVGLGSLTLSDSGSTIRGTVNIGGTSPYGFSSTVVLYIDSRAGGFADTTGFSDNSTLYTRAVSGYYDATHRATAVFAPNFAADYAIVLYRGATCMRLYELAAGPTLPDFIKSASFIDNGTTWQFSFDLSDIGATEPYFKFQSTTTTENGSRYLESYEPLTGAKGFNTVTFGSYNTFGATVPETTNAALAVFGGLVLTAGLGSRLRRHLRRKA